MSCLTLATPWTVARQTSLSIGFSRQEYWSGLPFPSPMVYLVPYFLYMGFPDSSVGKESACNAGDPGLILGSGRSAGKEIGYPLQHSWASLMAPMVKNLPALQET